MFYELIVLLVFLCFLAVRNDFVSNRLYFALSLFFWGAGRLLTEFGVVAQGGGSLAYRWGSLVSYAAAFCLFLCLVFMFLSCLRPRPVPAAEADAGKMEAPHEGDAQEGDPSERLRRIIEREP